MAAKLEARSRIALVLADVDGTLVTEDKVLTERARAAVHRLHEAGIRFAITSGRPPRGMAMLIEPLALDTPIAGFNGSVFAKPDLSIIEERSLAPEASKRAVEVIWRAASTPGSTAATTGSCATLRRPTSPVKAGP